MAMRSWLFVPADSEKKLGKALATGADVLILDLEDSVVPANKAIAREMARGWLDLNRNAGREAQRVGRWVRINALDTGVWRDDLVSVMPGQPDGIVLPKAAGPESVQQVAAELYELEQRHGIAPGSTRILPLVSETALAAIGIASYAAASLTRLIGLTWGAEDLSAAIGATRKRDRIGAWTDTFRYVRSQTLLTAHACGVMAIDTLHSDFADLKGLSRAAEESRADGFAGMLAIHPAQVAVINQAFTPGEAELAEARAIVEAFAANPTAGALQIAGKMIDRPHLMLAKRVLGIDD
ncbi:MAG: CoA ester lyase [Novosphingobium sp.]|uniref:HpcH/HpaI aldolase/citrate lyase family protein n=1 Tax=Novosphingobium sp. TaxID=1874826 RepID=UPI00181DAD74|nr:CoA ester lyase [Novosphingobium sp.]